MQIECRSPEAIADDELIEALEICAKALNTVTPGYGYEVRGGHRERVKNLEARLEGHVLNGTAWRERVNPVYLAVYIVGG